MARPYVPIIHGATRERPDEADTWLVTELIHESLQRLGYDSDVIALDLDLSVLETLARRNPYAVFNLVESLKGDAGLSFLAPAALDHLQLAYTGARTAPYFVTLSKLLTKQTLRAQGLPTAEWWERGRDVPADMTVIVKSVLEHASVGMDANSVVKGAKAAREIAAREARYGGRFFAERFIEGREFTLSLLETQSGPRIFPIHELDFSRLPATRLTILDYSAKWDTADPAYCLMEDPKFGLEQREPALAVQMQNLARNAWDAFGLNGYARVDFRVDTSGAPYILEINVNPCLAIEGGFVRMAAEGGLGYDDVIAALIACARPQTKQAA